MPKYLTFDKKRPLSWSAISSFEYDREQWYRKYVLKEEDETNAAMAFGSFVGKQLEKNKKFMPHIVRQDTMEYEFKVKLGRIPLIGYADSFCKRTLRVGEEYKTGKKEWNQKRADEHGQITMYTLMNWIQNGVVPEEMQWRIHWMPTVEMSDFSVQLLNKDTSHTFETRRTTAECLEFGTRIKRIYKEMEEYCKNHD